LNHAHRTTVHSILPAVTTASAAWASSSPRPDSSTSRRTPARSAIADSSRTASTAPGTARSGKYEMYMAAIPSTAIGQVAGFSQSNGGVPPRAPRRTGTPRASSRSATRRPVLPVAPRTSVVSDMVSSDGRRLQYVQ
jgi:hypothetical protein